MEHAILVATIIMGFALMVGFAGFGSAIGDGIIGSKLIESVARQPEAQGKVMPLYFLGVGILEAFPVIAIAFAFFLLLGGFGVGVMKSLTP